MAQQHSIDLDARSFPIANRANVYALFGWLFTYPGGDAGLPWLQAEAASALSEVFDGLPYRVSVQKPIAVPSPEQPAAYTRLFDNCTGRALVSLQEKDHVPRDAQKLWEELIRYYEHFGLRYEVGEAKQWPDALGVELEFMHYLVFLEAADPDQADDLVRAQADFIERHLAAWVPALSVRIADAGADTSYACWSAALAEFIRGERTYLETRRATSFAA